MWVGLVDRQRHYLPQPAGAGYYPNATLYAPQTPDPASLQRHGKPSNACFCTTPLTSCAAVACGAKLLLGMACPGSACMGKQCYQSSAFKNSAFKAACTLMACCWCLQVQWGLKQGGPYLNVVAGKSRGYVEVRIQHKPQAPFDGTLDSPASPALLALA